MMRIFRVKAKSLQDAADKAGGMIKPLWGAIIIVKKRRKGIYQISVPGIL